ncbi:dihydrodipicolinate synthase family protein, partial [Halobium palmae]
MLDVSKEDITEGSIPRTLAFLATPIVAQQLVLVGQQVIDIFWVGRLGEDAVAAIGLLAPVIGFLSVGTYIAYTGGQVVVSQRVGANDAAGNATFLRRVADESALPLYLYNIPACTGQEISPAVLAEVADHDRIRGLKDSSGDFNYFVEALRRTPADFDCYQGFDSYLVPGMLQGGTGGVNALSNAIPEAFAAAASAA